MYVIHPKLYSHDMRVLNSGRRWGNDVPTSLDLSRDIDILGVQVSDRSIKQTQMCRRLTALEAQLRQVLPCIYYFTHQCFQL
jgi:uncharacterized protein YgbK (DUF1537 family)